jgi:hypothetical protein
MRVKSDVHKIKERKIIIESGPSLEELEEVQPLESPKAQGIFQKLYD